MVIERSGMNTIVQFEAIMTDTQSSVRAYIASMGVPLDYVDDVAQEVYLDFYRTIGDLRPDVDPLRWLKGMARKRCLKFFHQRKKRNERMLATAAELLARTETSWDRRSTQSGVQDALEDCMDKMPERSRKIVAMRYEQDLASSEIGSLLEMTAEAVRGALMRIRAALKECVERALAG